MSGRPPLWAYASLAASMALVGSYVGLSKLLVAAFPVLLLAWLRFGIAALAMLRWVRRAGGDAPLSRHHRRLLVWESFLGHFLFSICMLYGGAMTSPSTLAEIERQPIAAGGTGPTTLPAGAVILSVR